MTHLGYDRAMGPQLRPYDGMSDDDLMDLAKKTLAAAAELPPHSIERAMKFAAYDSVVGELKRRLARQLAEGLGFPDAFL